MITFFSIPKPFKGHIAIIQENAIKSWLQLGSNCEIILYGNEEGVKEICEKYNIIHVGEVEVTIYGTPILNYIFKNVQEIASNETICYINSDIILLSDVITTINRIPYRKFLLVGKRFDIDQQNIIDFENPDWEKYLRDYVIANHMPLHGGIDYFIFPRGLFLGIPPFAVGRGGWDTWMIYNSRRLEVPTIDVTNTIMAIHQNHSYDHVPLQRGQTYLGPETDNNFKLSGNRYIYLWNLEDVDWILTSEDLIRKDPSLREYYRLLILKSPPIFHSLLEAIFWIQHLVRYKKLLD